MYTITIYWNATKFTTYKHVNIEHLNGWVILKLSEKEEFQIPSTTINRMFVKREDS